MTNDELFSLRCDEELLMTNVERQMKECGMTK